jgi:hypothetical protein
MGEPEVSPVSKKGLEIEEITAMGRIELLRHWPEHFEVPAPPRASPEFLRMALAWRVQTKRSGASTSRMDRQLRRIGELIAEGRTPRALDDRPKARGGAILVRTWRDKTYTVTVSDKGYVLEGVTYRSLSQVARKITGTSWNGPQFFGLRSTKGLKAAEVTLGK